MAIDRFNGVWSQRTDQFDQVTPNTKYTSDHIVVPGGEFKPAAWLPVVWQDQASKDYFVISSGKVVAKDTEGRLVPAGYAIKMISDNLVYTATDVLAGVVDLTTGNVLTTTHSYTPTQVAQAIVERGMVLETDISSVTAAEVIPVFISPPVGIAQDDIYVWAGEGPGELTHINYQKQHLVSYMQQVQMIVPYMASSFEDADTFDAATLAGGGTETYAAGKFPAATEFWDATNVSQVNRYADLLTASSDVVALGLAHQPIARDTDRTPILSDTDGVLVRARSGVDQLVREGDYYFDADVGVLFLHSDTWATLVAGAVTISLSYYWYDSATAAGERYIHLDGRARIGQKVTFDADSNFTVADLTTATFYNVLGTIDSLVVQPRGLLDRVRTAWNFTGVDKTAQMPGSATKGFTDLITLTDETVADSLAIISISIK